MVPPKNEWWCEALLCYKRAGLWTMYLEKIKNLGQNGGAGPAFGGMERSRLCVRKYRYRHLQESESRSHQPSHESFCIRTIGEMRWVLDVQILRSEERRVGKECRSRW